MTESDIAAPADSHNLDQREARAMDWRWNPGVVARLRIENLLQPETLQRVSKSKWPERGPADLIEVWRSKRFLSQVFRECDDIERLSVCRTDVNETAMFHDGITWEELQQLKRECGRGAKDAVEVFPADEDVVNVANMRHLWVFPGRLGFAWRKRQPTNGG